MVPHVVVINAEKNKVPKDLLIKSSELFFDFLKSSKIINDDNPVEFTMDFVSLKMSLEYNRVYRNKNVPTDVLSFYTEVDESVLSSDHNVLDKIRDLGDLVLCGEVIKDNAIRFGVSFEEELIRVTIHGILHLLGYDHSGLLGESKEEIFQIQEDFIKELKNRGFMK